MELLFVDALEHKEEIADLLEEYTGLLVSLNPGFSKYLDQQDFSHELEDPGLKYGHEGRLFVVLCDGEVAGCAGFKHLDASSCELKRMYLRPAFRKKHLGTLMLEKCIKEAEEMGYENMYLDTLKVLESAINLYREHGFEEIRPYNSNPVKDDMLYFRRKLQES